MKKNTNHARTKEKRKKLRLKALKLRIWIGRAFKKMKAGTFEALSPAEMNAVALVQRRKEYDNLRAVGHPHPAARNQRQKRKRWAQNPHTRNK